jgi:hypothetical protein
VTQPPPTKVCALCGTSPHQIHSHVIPRWLWKIVDHDGVVAVRWFAAGAWSTVFLPREGTGRIEFLAEAEDLPSHQTPGFLREDDRLYLILQHVADDPKTQQLAVGDRQIANLQGFLQRKDITL